MLILICMAFLKALFAAWIPPTVVARATAHYISTMTFSVWAYPRQYCSHDLNSWSLHSHTLFMCANEQWCHLQIGDILRNSNHYPVKIAVDGSPCALLPSLQMRPAVDPAGYSNSDTLTAFDALFCSCARGGAGKFSSATPVECCVVIDL